MKYNYPDGSSSSTLLTSKARLTPLSNKTLKTVPRIELASAKLSVELCQKVQSELGLKLNSIHYYTDSVTVLRYLCNESSRFHRFVDNKVCFIRSFSTPEQWYYVPSEQNPADIASRGSKVEKLKHSELWHKGPKFLTNEDLFPSQSFSRQVPLDDTETKSNTNTIVSVTSNSTTPTDQIMESVSDWNKLKYRIASLLLLKKSLRDKTREIPSVTVEDLNEAETAIFKYAQTKFYSVELKNLKEGKNVKSGFMRKLHPFVDNSQLIRVGGRLQNSCIPFNTKHPIILPADCTITKLLMENVHRNSGHLGRETILSTLRRKFWIVKGNALARKITNSCFICCKIQAKPMNQIMGELPAARISGDLPAFSHIGIDFFGPFIVTVGRRTEKRYGCIFSCMASRAIHLELAHSLSTDSFIQAFRRFLCRRGNVQSVTSDNGTNLVSANKELKEAVSDWNENALDLFMKQNSILWNFNAPAASHWGGFYEREIRTIRKTFNAILLEQRVKLYDENLQTFFCEIECILNNRPITEISTDPYDSEPLTPNHLLLGQSGITFPPGIFKENENYHQRKWRQIQYLANLFWKRWHSQYLVLLNQRQKWQTEKRVLKIGDMVLVVETNLPRNEWLLGRIVDVERDKYGHVRSANIRVTKCKYLPPGKFGTTIMKRPITKLVLLSS